MTGGRITDRIPRPVVQGVVLAAGLALTAAAVAAALRQIDPAEAELSRLDYCSLKIGRLAAVLALVVLTTQHLFSVRLRLLDEAFGLDRLLRRHAVRGCAAVLLASVHPFLVCGRHLYTVGSVGSADPAIYVGAGVLVLLWLIAVTSMRRAFLQLSYEAWKRVHLLTFVIVLGGLGHSFGVNHDFWSGWWLIVAIALIVTAAGPLVWSVVRWALLMRREWTVAAVEPVARRTVSLRLKPPEGFEFNHLPGQFAFLAIRGGGVARQEHPFTISSAPGDEEGVTFTVRGSGDYTSTLGQVRVGATARVDGPFGLFSYTVRAPKSDLLLIAAGIGATPMLSMLRSLVAADDPRRVTLICVNHTEADIPFRDELDAIAAERPNVRIAHVLTRQSDWPGETGRLDAAMLERLLTDEDRRAAAFVCGPPGMMTATVAALRKVGVPRRRIHTERFEL